ncbi:MAG: hypothetical protein WCA20_18970, partial [Candidatus Sulfotelmatobacter sp.]
LRKSCGATDGRPQLFAFAFTIAHMTLGVKPSPQILPALLIDRNNGPEVMPGTHRPAVNRLLHPLRNGDRSDVAPFSSQVSDDPMAFPKLKIL